jgi:hypothetical protein
MHGLVSGMDVNLTAMSLTRRNILLSCEMSSVFGVLLCISWGKAIGSLSYKFLIIDADLPAYAFYNNWVAPWSIDTLHIFVNPWSRILHIKLVAWPGQDFSHCVIFKKNITASICLWTFCIPPYIQLYKVFAFLQGFRVEFSTYFWLPLYILSSPSVNAYHPNTEVFQTLLWSDIEYDLHIFIRNVFLYYSEDLAFEIFSIIRFLGRQ